MSRAAATGAKSGFTRSVRPQSQRTASTAVASARLLRVDPPLRQQVVTHAESRAPAAAAADGGRDKRSPVARELLVRVETELRRVR